MKYSGYVYLIGSPTFGWYKIGKSISPEIRVTDIGVLLPFKIHVIGVWGAANHHEMEKALHEIHKSKRINGEWFEFEKKEVYEKVFNAIPVETRIYPTENLTGYLDKFTNIDADTKRSNKVLGIKVQKLRGNFTPEEREQKRQDAIAKQKEKKELKAKLNFSRVGLNNV